jgi:LSD1 subclass zinc finger protein
MAVNSELLKMLVCPVCRTAVEVVDGGQALKCSECHRVYPIRDDIPIMLVSEAKVEN